MATRKKYRVVITWQHKYLGPQIEKQTGEGTSIRRAISNVLLAFFSSSNKRHVRDAHAEIHVSAARMKAPAAR